MTRRDADAGFLGRWSERKLRARTEPGAEHAPAHEHPVEAPDAPARTEAEVLEELGLPDPDMLRKGDDFSGFMKAAVPTAIRNRALRRLWLSDPVLANLDGLNDYEQDFTDAATVVKNLKTAYQVGRGYLRDEPEPATEEAPETEPAAGEQAETDDADAPAGAEASDEVASAGDPPGQIVHREPATGTATAPDRSADEPGEATGAPPETPAPPRRMRFRFEA